MSKREEGKWETATKRVTVRWGTCKTCKRKITHKDDLRRYDVVFGYDPGVEKGESPTQCSHCRDSYRKSRRMAKLRKELVGARITGVEFDYKGVLADVYVAVPHSKEFGGKSGSCRLSAGSIVVEPDCPQDSDDSWGTRDDD